MHADGGWGEGVVGREEKGAPILAAFVRCLRRACEDVMPSSERLAEYVGP